VAQSDTRIGFRNSSPCAIKKHRFHRVLFLSSGSCWLQIQAWPMQRTFLGELSCCCMRCCMRCWFVCFFFAADFWNFSVSGFNVLSLAVLKQHVDVVRLLIAAGADVNAAISSVLQFAVFSSLLATNSPLQQHHQIYDRWEIRHCVADMDCLSLRQH
jgi:hypothetical protein